MPRIPRIILEGVPYHITQRGNGRQQIFFEDRDYALYQDLLRESCRTAHMAIWAYCLMPNHVHLIAVPARASAMPQAMARVNAHFARYFNLKKRSCGHVWQARYHSTPLDTTHLWRAMAYVERNPVRACLVSQAEHYQWSSAHLRAPGPHNHNNTAGATPVDLTPWQARYDWPRWQEALRTSIDEEAFGQRLQEASRLGRPLGAQPFVEALENRCGRPLRPLPPGRPKKPPNDIQNQLALGSAV